VHNPEYPIESDLPGAIIVGTSACLVNPGVVEISYDVAAGVLIITPVSATSSEVSRMTVEGGVVDEDDGELVDGDFLDDEVKDPM